jgi:hypothetical protein
MNGSSTSVSKSFIKKYIDVSNAESIVLTCDNKNLPITTPSSASGVPNDYINNVNILYSDPNVPLYNYINPVLTRAYGIINSSFPTDVIQYSNYTDVNTVSSFLTTVEFTDATTNDYYVVSLSNIPLAIQIYGDITGTISSGQVSIIIKDISLNIYYNKSLITPNSAYIYTVDPSNTYIVDISNTKIGGKTFSETVYIGNLSIANILLYSSPSYFYDFKLKFNIVSTTISTSLSNISVSIIANVTNTYLLNHLPYNCDISFSNKTPDIINNFGVFTISAI